MVLLRLFGDGVGSKCNSCVNMEFVMAVGEDTEYDLSTVLSTSIHMSIFSLNATAASAITVIIASAIIRALSSIYCSVFRMASNPSSGEASNPSIESTVRQSSRPKTDPAWQYCTETIVNTHLEIKCMFCNKTFRGGGIRRFKYHLSGLFGGGCAPCARVNDEVKHTMKLNIESGEALKKNIATKKSRDYAFENKENDIPFGSKRRIASTSVQPSDSINLLSPTFMPRTTVGCQPTIRNVFQGKAVKDAVDLAVAKWFYDASIPFNAVNSVLYQPMINVIASYGKGYEGPNLHSLRGKLLKNCVELVNDEVKKHRDSWKETGCTLMADGWSDQNSRSLINFLVYSPKGTLFLKSVDASAFSKIAVMLFGLFKEVILLIGPENIMQVVTDNAANYVAAGRLIEAEFPTISWSPCAAHCLNLMYSDIGKLERVSNAVDQASKITKFIYNHCFVLSMMRRFTNGRNLLRPAPTRFATNFVALQSILSHKEELIAMISSRDWKASSFAKDIKGKQFVSHVFDPAFWKECSLIVSITEPLVRVLRLVDSDERPAMGYLYAAIHNAREDMIKRFEKNKKILKPFIDIIDNRWDKQLHKNLHSAGFWFNPHYQYNVEMMEKHYSCHSAILDVIEKYSNGNLDLTRDLTKEIKLYRNSEGDFGRSSAITNRCLMLPDEWWSVYGTNAPNLKKLAIRVLSQTCSSSGCERNWSVFEHIHSKKRNRLEHQRLNDLVFVHYNLRLGQKRELKGRNYDPISFLEFDENNTWVLEDEPPLLTVDEINALYNEEDVNCIATTQLDNNDLEVPLDDIEIDVVDNNNHGVGIDDIICTEEGLQEVNDGVETFNFEPRMSYTEMLQVAQESAANSRQPSEWTMNI